MKKVVSVSLGSSKRDHSVEVNFLGEKFEVSRRGTDGDIDRPPINLASRSLVYNQVASGGRDNLGGLHLPISCP